MSNELPWFPFDPADWLTDIYVKQMSLAQRGAYITLLAYEWLEGWLPTDAVALRSLVGVSDEEWSDVWAEPLVGRFKEDGEKLFNPRLEVERKKAMRLHRDRVKWGKEGARKRLGNKPSKVRPKGTSSQAKAEPERDQRHIQLQLQKQSKEPDPDKVTGIGTAADDSAATPSPSRSIWWNREEGKLDGSQEAKRELADRFVHANKLTLEEFKEQIEDATYWLAERPHRRKKTSKLREFLVNWLNGSVKDKRSGVLAMKRREAKDRRGPTPEGFKPKWCAECRETLPAHADWCSTKGKDV